MGTQHLLSGGKVDNTGGNERIKMFSIFLILSHRTAEVYTKTQPSCRCQGLKAGKLTSMVFLYHIEDPISTHIKTQSMDLCLCFFRN
jgi:hypothetical protein